MRWTGWVAAGAVGVLVVASGGYAVAQARDSGTAYATATATRADVQRTLSLSGTVAASGRRDLSFGVAGTLTKVAVRAGQRLKAGQVVARLDPSSFEATVTSVTATLAKAKAQLASDEDAQSATITTSATTTTKKKKKATGTKHASTGSSASSQALAALKSQQQAVTSAQSTAGAAITTAKAALADQQQRCAASDTSAGSANSTPAGGSTDPTSPGPGTPSGTGSSGVSAQCTDALAAVQSAQDTVSTRQDALQQALTTLAGTLQKATAALAQSTPSSSGNQTTSNQQASSQQSVTASSSGSGSGSGSSQGGAVTAARLAQDQADIDTASAQLTSADAQLESATLRAPYAGRVLEVPVARTDAVGTSDTIAVLVGKGVTTVTTTVTTAQRPDVRRGQSATVLPAGATQSLRATVSAIGLLPDSDSAYPVTLTVATDKTVAEGSTVSVSLVTGTAHDAVTVPTSAVSRIGTGTRSRSTVSVLSSGTVTRTLVQVGVVGSRRTSITSGLRAGQTVVLADLGATVPTSTTSNRTRFANGGFGGGFGGAQGGPGGR